MRKRIPLGIISVFVFLGIIYVVLANTGNPTRVSAVYNTGSNTLTVSGAYDNVPCNNRVGGIAVFVDGANPRNPGNGSLDSAIHVLNGGVCATSGTFNEKRQVNFTPQTACVVIYDLHLKKGKPQHLVPAGNGRNGDNSFDKNGNSYANQSCSVVVTPH